MTEQFKYEVGSPVRIRFAEPAGHCRTPYYVRGKRGVIHNRIGHFGNSETLAYGHDGLPKLALYRVWFRQQELWPEYRGSEADSLTVDIFEHWIEPQDEEGTDGRTRS